MADKSRFRVFLCASPALLLAAACLLPYLDKAFTIDDAIFLQEAQQILKTPLHPQAVEICWMSTVPTRAAEIVPNNALLPYFLAPVVRFGSHEWFAHSLQIAFLWLAILATVSLAFRFGCSSFAAVAAGLIFATTPPVLAMASTAMPDVLAMTLGVIGIERVMAWKQNRRLFDGLTCAVALGLAPFARVHLVLLLPIAALLLRGDVRIFDVRSWFTLPKRLWWPLAGAVLVMIAVNLLTMEPASGGVLPHHMYIQPENTYRNLRSYLIDWMLAMPLGLAWILLAARRVKMLLLLISALAALAIWKSWTGPAHVIWVTLIAAAGLLALIDFLAWAWRTGEYRWVACGLWMLLPLVNIVYLHLPVKYLTASAPAAALLIASRLDGRRWRKVFLCGIVGAAVAFSGLVLHADYAFANMGREAVRRLIVPHLAEGDRVWFASMWGFQWYALQAGARHIHQGETPASGDYLARGELEGYLATMKRLPPAVLVETFVVGGPCGRTMSRQDGAGLYSNFYGDLMWAWGSGQWNRYELWRFR
ncbi:MAG: hypothetical protein ACLQPN_17755 [Bryobacteraceae bacterium]